MTRIFAISDIHYGNTIGLRSFMMNEDDVFNMFNELCENSKESDVLILAGDFDFYFLLPTYFRGFKGKKIIVFGNHDYWYVDTYNWYERKLTKSINDYCLDVKKRLFNNNSKHQSITLVEEKTKYLEENDFIVMNNKDKCIELEDCCIVADGLWYDYSFIDEKKIPPRCLIKKKMTEVGQNNDGVYVKRIGTDKEFFDMKIKHYENQLINANKTNKPIISVSHFLPRNDLIDNKIDDYWFFDAFLGSTKIHELNKKYNVDTHLYGHIHWYTPEEQSFPMKEIDGIKMINVSLFNLNHTVPIWEGK